MAKRLNEMALVRVAQEMKAKAERYPTCGYRKIAAMLRLDGWAVTDAQVRRLWWLAGMRAQL